MSTATAGWRVALEVPAAAVDAFAAALQSHCAAISWFGEDQGPWQIEGYAPLPPDPAALAVALALAAAASDITPPQVKIEPLPPTNWAHANLDAFPPLTIGRFFVHGSHDSGVVPGGRIGLRVDAATAFGSGRHASTAGCLEALGLLAHRRISRPLDMGCGSGILAIAAARLWQSPVVAVDNDPEATIVTRRNAARNRVGRLVRALCADSYAAPGIAARAPYDLIVCNILARPLRRMARDLARCLAPGGVAVLSGFLAADAGAVLAAHRLQGLRLIRRITIDDWQTLIVGRQQNTCIRRRDA
jgi:ribosomal protein L11 methyltransferase